MILSIIVHSNHGSVSSPFNSFDLLFTPVSPSNDLNSLLSSSPSINKKDLSSPLHLTDPTSLLFSNSDIYTTSSSPISSIQTDFSTNQSRSSTRLRQLLATKSCPSTSASPHKSHTNTFDELIQVAESPTTTHVSPLSNDLPSPTKRRRNPSQTNGLSNTNNNNNNNNSADILLKQLLGGQTPLNTNSTDNPTIDNNSTWSSPKSVPTIKIEADDNTSNIPGGTNKLRSDTFLRVSLENENVKIILFFIFCLFV